MITGSLIFGFGGETTNVILCTIVGKFFKGKEESFSLALLYASSNIGLSVCCFITPIIYKSSQTIETPIQVSFIIGILVSVLTTIIFYYKPDDPVSRDSTNSQINI
jgi:hypothetical protein